MVNRIVRYLGLTILSFISILLLTVFVAGCRGNLAVTKPVLDKKVDFRGTLLALSDADQIGTSYADGVVNKQLGLEDSLAIIQFIGGNQFMRSVVYASNSVVSWPSVVAHSKDKRFAYIAETRGRFPNSIEKVKSVWSDLPEGTLITVVDVQTKQVVQRKELGKNLSCVSVNFDGTLLATASSDEDNQEIIVATLKNGLIDKVFNKSTSHLVRQDIGSDSGIKTVEFSPTENVLAVNLHTEDIAFYQIKSDSVSTTIDLVGEPMQKVATCWSVGNWTPNGKFFILTDVAWGDGDMGAVFNKEGSLIAVQYNKEGAHKIISEASVGLSPEGFDVSPDGKWAIVANMRRTYLPGGLPFALFPARKQASLSLVKVNSETGELKTIGKEYGFEGELPEDVVFDAESKTIAVAIFNDRYERKPKFGFIEFWVLEEDRLTKLNLRIPVTRGVHNLKLMK